jgi:iron(III) transport system substrate-binding protein
MINSAKQSSFALQQETGLLRRYAPRNDDKADDRQGNEMPKAITRRDLIEGSAALGLTVFASPLKAATPEPVAITSGLVEAAGKEGKVIFYSSMDLPVGEKLGKAFEAKYPGVTVQIERSGSERLFQRVDQEFGSGVHSVDVINTSDASHIISWKNNGWLAPFVSEDIAKYFLPEFRDPDGMSATSRIYLSSIAYNTNLVKPEDAPKKLRRSARPEMGRQDGQGPSRL